jgi:ketohexokinase/beta-glucosidase
LKREEFSRHIARRKSSLSEINRLQRLEWAIEHVSWTKEQWMNIFWSDETWINDTKDRIWITRRAHEKLNSTCIVFRYVRRRRWMFWACFANHIKESCLFWEKNWYIINQEFYCQRVVFIVQEWISMNSHLLFMQNNASSHAAQITIKKLESRDISTIFWFAYSLDLNSIETVWHIMKSWIELHYDEHDKLSYDQLRQTVRETWDAVTPFQLDDLINSMSARCQIVINAKNRHTKYWMIWFDWWKSPLFKNSCYVSH